MKMNWKKGLLLGIALWVLIFFEVSILMFGFKLSSPDPNYYLIHAILLTVFIIVLSLIYFSDKKTKKGMIKGIVLGIVFVVIGVILDSVITIPLFVKDWEFFFKTEMLVSYLWEIILCGFIGWIKVIKKKK